MPLSTKNYNLQSFLTGQPFSGQVDKRRMNIIDAQAHFYSRYVDGMCLEGWDILNNASDMIIGNTLSVSAGSGFIDSVFCRSFGNLNYQFSQLGVYEVYMQKKYEYTAFFGKFSKQADFVSSGLVAPAKITGLVLQELGYNYVKIKWNNIYNPDFKDYIIKRSINGIDFQQIGTSNINSYSDINLSDNTIYYYKVIQRNLSMMESVDSDILSVTTSYNLSQPDEINDLKINIGAQQINAAWTKPLNIQVQSYIVNIYQYSDDRSVISLVSNSTTTDTFIKVQGLTNEKLYKLEIFSVSYNGVQSDGVSYQVNVQDFNKVPSVSNMLITESQNIQSEYGIQLNIKWQQVTQVGKPIADIFGIVLVKDGQQSDVIQINKNVTINNQTNISSASFFGTIQGIYSRQLYRIDIYGIDNLGNAGVKNSIYFQTGNFLSPQPISNVHSSYLNSGLRQNNGILFTWDNSQSVFQSNIISVKQTDIFSGYQSYILLQQDIKQSNSYVIQNISGQYNKKWTIYIKTKDQFNLVSQIVSGQFTSENININQYPLVPFKLFCLQGNGQIYLSWQSKSDKDKNYYIWRVQNDGSGFFDMEDYELIGSVQYPLTEYIDYSGEINKKYAYFVLVQDVYGRKNKNPIDDKYNAYSYVSSVVSSDTSIKQIEDVSVTQNLFDCVVSWTLDLDNYDGHQIWRRDSENNQWTKVGYVARQENSFIDINGILINNITYSYMVRKYRDQTRLNVVKYGSIPPQNSILIAQATYDGSSIQIDVLKNNVDGIYSLISKVVDSEIANHNHKYLDYDKRISLYDNVIIKNFTSKNKTLFSTTDIIPKISNYVVFIDGAQYLGIYSINIQDGTILFKQKINGQIQILCIGIRQTQNILPNRHIKQISASIFTSGVINKKQIQYYHEQKNKFNYLKQLMKTKDGYLYSTYDFQTKKYIGSAIDFYDIQQISGVYVAASSYGLIVSQDNGVSWEQTSLSDKIIHSVKKINDILVAVGNSGVYISDNGSGWISSVGLQSTSAVRDVCYDGSDLFASTNLGVYLCQNFSISNYEFSATELISGMVTDCYGIYFNAFDNSINTSTDYGIYKTIDSGVSWSSSSDFSYFGKIYKFIKQGDYIFGIGDGLFRKYLNLNFSKILDLSKTSSIQISDDRIILVINGSSFISNIDNNIYIDSIIQVQKKRYLSSSVAGKNVFFTKKIQNDLFVGGQDVLSKIILNLNNIQKVYQKDTNNYISIYKKDQILNSLVFVNVNTNSVWFVQHVRYEDKIGFVNNYDYIKIQPWIDSSYQSSIGISKNGIKLYQSSGLSHSYVRNIFKKANFSLITQANSNYQLANKYINEFNFNLNYFQQAISDSSNLQNGDSIQDVAYRTAQSYRKSFQRNRKSVKYFSILNIGLNQYSVVDSFILTGSRISDYFDGDLVPNFFDSYNQPITGTDFVYYNASSGIIKINNNKKHDFINIELSGRGIYNSGIVTHEKIQDGIYSVNSGLTYSSAQIYNQNIISLGNLLQRQYPGQTRYKDSNGTYVFNKYMKNIIPQYLQQFDAQESSVFFSKQDSHESYGFNMQYISKVEKFGTKYILSNMQFSISADDTTFNFNPIFMNDTDKNFININDLYLNDSNLYFVSNKYIHKTEDLVNFQKLNTYGVIYDIIKFFIFNGCQYVITKYAIYRRIIGQAEFILVKQISRYDVVHVDNYIILVDNNQFFKTTNGLNWSSSGTINQELIISDIKKYKNQYAIATSKGLYYDYGTIIGGSLSLQLVDIDNDTAISGSHNFNTIFVGSGSSFLCVGENNGIVYKIDGDIVLQTYVTGMPTVRFIHVDGLNIRAFGDNSIFIQQLGNPIKIATGTPF